MTTLFPELERGLAQPERAGMIKISAFLRHETPGDVRNPGAYMIHDGIRTVWLPKSQVEYDGKNTFTMPEWLARKHGLIE